MTVGEAAGRGRPPISVVVPFGGDARAAGELVDALTALKLRDGDEIIVVDNSLSGAALRAARDDRSRVSAIPARERRSSYYARNVGARAARRDWLLFLDSDCRPAPSLLDDYFASPIANAAGAVAGTVDPIAAGDGLVARHSRSRPYLDQATFLAEPRGGFAATANLLVRREPFDQLGGFCEVRSGGDVDFSWRLAEAGWSLVHQPAAVVWHRHRDALAPLLRQRVHYGAGERWLARRWPERRRLMDILPAVARRLAGGVLLASRGRREEALFSLLDAAAFGGEAFGWLFSNEARPWPRSDDDDPRAADGRGH